MLHHEWHHGSQGVCVAGWGRIVWSVQRQRGKRAFVIQDPTERVTFLRINPLSSWWPPLPIFLFPTRRVGSRGPFPGRVGDNQGECPVGGCRWVWGVCGTPWGRGEGLLHAQGRSLHLPLDSCSHVAALRLVLTGQNPQPTRLQVKLTPSQMVFSYPLSSH